MEPRQMSRRALLAGAATIPLAGCAEVAPGGGGSPGEGAGRPERRTSPSARGSRSATASPSSSVPTADDWEPVRRHWDGVTLERFTGTVQHLFLHQMIPFPEVAFASREGQDFDDWYLTKDEVLRLLDHLRARRYILVDLADCFVRHGRSVVPNPDLRVPRGHRPLVLSIDDLSFNRFLLGKGFMDRIVVDRTGHLSCVGTDPRTGRALEDPTNCIVSHLDQYLRRHPEFSLGGAAGTLALTGYEGVLGYRTDRHEHDRAAQQAAARPVIALMKRRGWTFASHSYGHIDLGSTTMTPRWVADDTAKWLDEAGDLLGPTKLYITPFGAMADPAGPIMKVILDAGFDVICDVSDRTAVVRHPERGFLVQSRLHVDGYGMRHTPQIYRDFFDVEAVFDHRHRLPRWGRRHL